MKRGRFSEEQIIRKLAERFGLPMQASSSREARGPGDNIHAGTRQDTRT